MIQTSNVLPDNITKCTCNRVGQRLIQYPYLWSDGW